MKRSAGGGESIDFLWSRIAALQRAYAIASDELTTINSGLYAVLGVSVAAALVFIGHVSTGWLLAFLAPLTPIAYVMVTRMLRTVPTDPSLYLGRPLGKHALSRIATALQERLQLRSDHAESVRRYELIAFALFIAAFALVAAVLLRTAMV